MRTHGMTGTSEYRTFKSAKARCTNPNSSSWKNYGARGIEFRFTSFETFFAELGPRPKGLTLDRINNDGHYEPGNVRWATRSEQMYNQRHDTEAQKKHRRENGRRVYKLHPGLALHNRWHVNRSIVNPNCELCQQAA
jgi:hypothetical protein